MLTGQSRWLKRLRCSRTVLAANDTSVLTMGNSSGHQRLPHAGQRGGRNRVADLCCGGGGC